jgi:ParB family transcriptional regulator, chromosome partitioning protein
VSAQPTPRLGRGLAALMGTPPAPDATPHSELPIAALVPGPFQPRGPIDDAELTPLVDSIRVHGVLQPLLVRPTPGTAGQFQIVAGERRWRAARLAALQTVPVHVRSLNDEEAASSALVENLQRQDLNPIEEAQGYQRLQAQFGWTQEVTAQRVGKSRSHIANTLRLLNLPAGVQTELRNGALSAGHARALLGHPDPARAALQVIAGGLNVRQTEDLAHRGREHRARRDEPRDPNTTALEHELSEKLGLRVQVTQGPRGGHVRISYSTFEQLDGLILLLSR